MDAIALRRNKTDKKPDGSPLVALPSKTVLVREAELTEEVQHVQEAIRGIAGSNHNDNNTSPSTNKSKQEKPSKPDIGKHTCCP